MHTKSLMYASFRILVFIEAYYSWVSSLWLNYFEDHLQSAMQIAFSCYWLVRYTLLRPKYTVTSVQSLSHVWLFVTTRTEACQASLSITNSRSLPKLVSIESVLPSNHLILCHPLLLPPSIFPNIRVFSNESVLRIRWPKDWSFSFNISPFNKHSGLISFRMDWLDLLAVQGTFRVFSNNTVQQHQFFDAQLSL